MLHEIFRNYKEVQEKALEAFFKKDLPVWIETHTKHLKDNGSNGHYVGNKVNRQEAKRDRHTNMCIFFHSILEQGTR